ncbi:MAG: system fructose subfamily component [bacterium]|nr:system fructose subfamily component [bacterium]
MSVVEVIVITHGNAAEDMVDAVERVVGKLNVRTISVRIGEPRADTESQIERVVDELHADEVLFLTDLEGSTPYNLCCKRCGGKSVVLSGMNLPMLMKLATANRALGALTLAEELRATGLKSIHIRSANGTK